MNQSNRRRLSLAIETMINKYVGIPTIPEVEGLTPDEQRTYLEVTDPITTKLFHHIPEAIREWLHRDKNNADARALIWGPYDPKSFRESTKGYRVMTIEVVYRNGPTQGLQIKTVLVNGKKTLTTGDHYGGDSWMLVDDKEHSQDLMLSHSMF